jgi:lipopolysaccharide export system permease protein
MGSIDRYVVRTTAGAFALILVSLTVLIWITQALREIDLMTNQRQTLLVFIGLTSLLIPVLVAILAPIALMIATAFTLNKFQADSELVVMSAAGVSPWRLLAPFMAVALAVSVMVAAISAYLSPLALRELRNWSTKLRADLVSTIIQPGRFTTLERNLTFHIRERHPNRQLVGILIDDRRDPEERATFLAERGAIIENEHGLFLVLESGSVQRLQRGLQDPVMVIFERYAFDLSQFSGSPGRRWLSARERYLWELIAPDPRDPVVRLHPGAFRVELHNRITAPFYPLALAVVVFAFLGKPSSSRQDRGLALAVALVAALTLQFVGFGSSIFAAQSQFALAVLYGSLLGAMVLGAYAIARGIEVEMPAAISRALAQASARLSGETTWSAGRR